MLDIKVHRSGKARVFQMRPFPLFRRDLVPFQIENNRADASGSRVNRHQILRHMVHLKL
ncbi:hypothetical protein SDC9_102471 [bioreactor metagenome]|uniref:Uncharacterized protein n=1 Tax=bioreactor metagenome TaxID=1076179 RepID=A0A645B1S2_9ZZZZ